MQEHKQKDIHCTVYTGAHMKATFPVREDISAHSHMASWASGESNSSPMCHTKKADRWREDRILPLSMLHTSMSFEGFFSHDKYMLLWQFIKSSMGGYPAWDDWYAKGPSLRGLPPGLLLFLVSITVQSRLFQMSEKWLLCKIRQPLPFG